MGLQNMVSEGGTEEKRSQGMDTGTNRTLVFWHGSNKRITARANPLSSVTVRCLEEREGRQQHQRLAIYAASDRTV